MDFFKKAQEAVADVTGGEAAPAEGTTGEQVGLALPPPSNFTSVITQGIPRVS